MLARDPVKRPAEPVAVMPILARFTTPTAQYSETDPATDAATVAEDLTVDGSNVETAAPPPRDPIWRVLIAGGHPDHRGQIRQTLESVGAVCGEARTGSEALTATRTEPFGVVIVEAGIMKPDAASVCKSLRDAPPRPHVKVFLHGAARSRDAFAEAVLNGADDYLPEPLDLTNLAAKVQHAFRLKDAQDRADGFSHHLLAINRQLRQTLKTRSLDMRRTQDAVVFAMAKLAEAREGENAGHLRRLQQYSAVLAAQLRGHPGWGPILTDEFRRQLERCVPLHDIGKLALPDGVLSKPGPLSPEERQIVETHTTIGAAIVDSVAREFGAALTDLATARGIVRHHHERWDGGGYPDRLTGDAIPPAARLTAIADVYDALRRKRPHKPAFSHARAVDCILCEMDGAFDPAVVHAFEACRERFQRIFLAVVS
jgi:putative two-component system response regulator